MEENKGKNISDHLANERTFLAWVRTGIGIMAFGFVVVKFSLFVKQLSFILQKPLPSLGHGYASVIGISLVALGIIITSLSYLRFKRIEKQINNASYLSNNRLSTLLTWLIILLGILLVIYLINSL